MFRTVCREIGLALRKIGSTDTGIVKMCKKRCFFFLIEPIFSSEAIILVQKPAQFCEIL